METNQSNRTVSIPASPRGLIGQTARIRELANLFIEAELRNRGVEGILAAHGVVLHFLFHQQQPVAIRDVVHAVRRVKSSVTEMLNGLERHGYVCKKASCQDNRVVTVALTDKGRAIQAHFEDISALLEVRMYRKMPEEDRRILMTLLRQVEDNLRDAASHDLVVR